MHSEAYRKSIAVKRESHNPQPALPLPLSLLLPPSTHLSWIFPPSTIFSNLPFPPYTSVIRALPLPPSSGVFALASLIFPTEAASLPWPLCLHLNLAQLFSLFCLSRNAEQVTCVLFVCPSRVKCSCMSQHLVV